MEANLLQLQSSSLNISIVSLNSGSLLREVPLKLFVFWDYCVVYAVVPYNNNLISSRYMFWILDYTFTVEPVDQGTENDDTCIIWTLDNGPKVSLSIYKLNRKIRTP